MHLRAGSASLPGHPSNSRGPGRHMASNSGPTAVDFALSPVQGYQAGWRIHSQTRAALRC